ncbi:protein of unknown function DUF1006 [Actinobacteria bacterium OK074]|nr:protein of unknown function DUF1006 [Actinobacteria bacterium OK074]
MTRALTAVPGSAALGTASALPLAREPLTVLDGVRHVVALQTRHPASPYPALRNRLTGFDPAELDAGFTGRSGSAVVVRRPAVVRPL